MLIRTYTCTVLIAMQYKIYIYTTSGKNFVSTKEVEKSRAAGLGSAAAPRFGARQLLNPITLLVQNARTSDERDKVSGDYAYELQRYIALDRILKRCLSFLIACICAASKLNRRYKRQR